MMKNKESIIKEIDNNQSRKFYKNLLGIMDKRDLVSIIERDLTSRLPNLIEHCLDNQDLKLIDQILAFTPNTLDEDYTPPF